MFVKTQNFLFRGFVGTFEDDYSYDQDPEYHYHNYFMIREPKA